MTLIFKPNLEPLKSCPMSSKRKSNQDSQKPRLVYSEFSSVEFDTSEDEINPAPEIPPNQQNVRIQASRKGRGGKTVTVITGLQSDPDTLTALLKKLKAQCGSGGTLKQSDEAIELEIQGDHCQKVLQLLVQMGYKAKISGGKG
jgi:translation initiation factor 1